MHRGPEQSVGFEARTNDLKWYAVSGGRRDGTSVTNYVYAETTVTAMKLSRHMRGFGQILGVRALTNPETEELLLIIEEEGVAAGNAKRNGFYGERRDGFDVKQAIDRRLDKRNKIAS